ncbi:MAG: four helix bundle protein [Candidatus Harrisonbacteria bacterium CG10_big_fil_rev_8_21_14_0_10_44_23]|uniref:Four helix bundle protein n=1 Tax=Candidatus Harrisonbacteria bacterium CG10_big_fil_rev_8_21_14_0_10_44_23 TaxID=1974585 RepID=A0A2H0US89_9BACT|nr:MAG: four helix bundle protein [Candidatus Harrisonbacteria bacterium CG10_big_fil_rev_8_21_14_0_10_44_23]
MPIKSYKDLIVWQKSMNLVTEIYKLSKTFPKSEIFGLTSQIKRSAVSIPSNIAEGSRRGSKKNFRHFLLNAYGSGAELETQLDIAEERQFA